MGDVSVSCVPALYMHSDECADETTVSSVLILFTSLFSLLESLSLYDYTSY